MKRAGSMTGRSRSGGASRAFLLLVTLAASFVVPLTAQDQTLQPNAENNPGDIFNDACSSPCNTVACDDDVDEGQAGTDNLEVSTTTRDSSITFEFPTPSANPSTAAGAQAMDIVMSRCDDDASCSERSGGADPPFSAWITCNGADAVQIFTQDVITSVDQLKTAAFTIPGACAADGSNMGVRIQLGRSGGNPSNRNFACIEAVDWDVTHGAGNSPPTASAADLTGQDDPWYAGVQYHVTAVYSDPDGAADLADLHLRLDHDAATDVELSVAQGAASTGSATVVSGAAFLVGTPTYTKTEGAPTANDVAVTWSYTLDWDWVESTLLEYGVRATDDSADSGWSSTDIDVRYENDLDLSGTLAVSGAVNGAITCGSDWVQGAESLTWTGVTAVYEGSGVSPADGDFDLRITDDDTGSWSQLTGAALSLGTTSDNATDPSDVHDVDLVNIPAGGSDVSAVSCEIKVDAGIPEILSGVAAGSPTSSSITISWTAYGGGDAGAVADSGFQTYRVYYDTSPGVTAADPVWDSGDDPALAGSGAATTTITGLASSTPYYFRVVGRDEAENEAPVAVASEVSDTTQAGAGDTLSASGNTPVEGGSPPAGTAGVVMQVFEVDNDGADDGNVVLSSVTVDDLGTAGAGDWSNLEIYIDVDATFAGATLIGQNAFDGTPTAVALDEPGTLAARTQVSGTPKYVFAVYDLGGAAAGETVKSRVREVALAAPDTGAGGLALDSNELLIAAAVANGTTIGSNAAVSSSCTQILVTGIFSGDDNDDGSSLVEYNTSNSFTGGQTTPCAQLTGPSPRQCMVVDSSISPGSANWVRVTWSDGDGVTLGGNPNPQVMQVNVQACDGSDNAAPTVLFLTPARGSVVSGLDRAKVQVFDLGGLAGTDPVQYKVDAGGYQTDAAVNNNYATLAGCTQPECEVWEFDLDTTGLANGDHRLTLLATDAAGNVTELSRGFQVLNLGTRSGGSGQLLRRSGSSQLCVDCHNMPTHSSQATGSKYGSWALDCMACHTPHNTKNIHLLRESIRTPNSGWRQVRFENKTGAVANSAAAGAASYVNEDNATQADGPCQVCHTRTKSAGGQARWRNADAGGNADSHYASGSGQACVTCHTHGAGFAGAGGGGCAGCHFGSGRTASGRRDVEQDYLKSSHHVGTGGTYMGGELTDHDCVVCHAEGTINGDGETETTATWHNNGKIDLKDADTWNDASPTASMIYVYDKDDIADNGGVSGPGDWSSNNKYWREWTSGVGESGGATLPAKAGLDPFCLGCHDSNGALAARNQNQTEGCVAGGDASNPFCDGTITNEYDQQDRGGVVDVKSQVSGSPPSQGVFSRHAIRGQSTSRYNAYQNLPSVCGESSNGPCDSMYEGDPTAGQSLFTNMGTDELGNPLWNDTSVMGCADCHTVDGANGSAGNAHGSNSEYLLKDDSGGATEGTLAGLSYGCYRCHKSGRYQPPTGSLGKHTENGADWQDRTSLTGLNRRDSGKGSNIFAMACTNCHGGVGFGSIHGTSDTFGMGQNGGSGSRNAYRFMNGASLRYYDPEGWSSGIMTCYTLSSADSWGGCTQHDKSSGADFERPLQRPLNY